MSLLSVHYDIRQAAVRLIQDQCEAAPPNAFMTGLLKSHVKNRMMPKIGEVVDTLPCIIVAPVTHIPFEPMGFEQTVNRTYRVEIAVVSASNQDFQANQEKYEGWLEEICRIAIGPPTLYALTTPACNTIWSITVDSSATFDRSKLAQNYSYQSVLVSYQSFETRNSP